MLLNTTFGYSHFNSDHFIKPQLQCIIIIIINSVQKFSAVPVRFIIIIKSVQKFSADTFSPIILLLMLLCWPPRLGTVQYDIAFSLDNVLHMLFIIFLSP